MKEVESELDQEKSCNIAEVEVCFCLGGENNFEKVVMRM